MSSCQDKSDIELFCYILRVQKTLACLLKIIHFKMSDSHFIEHHALSKPVTCVNRYSQGYIEIIERSSKFLSAQVALSSRIMGESQTAFITRSCFYSNAFLNELKGAINFISLEINASEWIV